MMKALSLISIHTTLIHSALRFILLLSFCTAGFAQTNNGGNNNGGNNQNGNNQNQNAGGITIDADGVIAAPFRVTQNSSQLNQRRLQALAAEALPADVNRKSEFRKISLVQLEKVCQ